MYGIINKALEDMVVRRHGADFWRRVKSRAGVDVEVFIGNEPYPDAVTYGLIGATAAESGSSAADVLFALGEWWVLETGQNEYPDLMAAGGRTLDEFLAQLPRFHTRVVMMLPELVPPRFVVVKRSADFVELEYCSTREGLAPMVHGMLCALAAWFRVAASVEQVAHRGQGGDADRFRISWSAARSV